MKKIIWFCAAAALAASALAEYDAVQLEAGDNLVPAPCSGVMLHAISTNAVTVAGTTNTVVETNFLARAMNAIPSVYPWPDLLITTNKLTGVEVYTNIPYKVESSRRVMPYTIQRRASKYVTNDVCNVTLASGFKTNAVSGVFAPGDYIYASGTAFNGGRVQLIIEK